MVGFTAPQPGSPEAWNRQMGGREFLAPAYHAPFEQLILEIRRLARETDELTLPDVNAAGAWARAYSVYEMLRDRHLKAEQQAHVEGARVQNYETRWNDFLTNRTTIIEGLRREVWDTTVLADVLDLLPGDLDPPTLKETNKYGSNRRPDWEAVAQRLDNAISCWHALSAEERSVLRSQRTLRHLTALKERRKQNGF
jgi:hypothetical protein